MCVPNEVYLLWSRPACLCTDPLIWTKPVCLGADTALGRTCFPRKALFYVAAVTWPLEVRHDSENRTFPLLGALSLCPCRIA